MTEQLSVFPAFFRVAQKCVAVFGNGDEAFAKVRLLMNTQAQIVVYADQPEADFAAFLTANAIETVHEPFAPAQVEGATLVFAATGDAAQDRAIVAAARAQKIPANAVDQPDYCDFLTPALVNRAPVAVAIGTEGAGPVLAQMIRAQIDQLLSPSLGALASLATGLSRGRRPARAARRCRAASSGAGSSPALSPTGCARQCRRRAP